MRGVVRCFLAILSLFFFGVKWAFQSDRWPLARALVVALALCRSCRRTKAVGEKVCINQCLS